MHSWVTRQEKEIKHKQMEKEKQNCSLMQVEQYSKKYTKILSENMWKLSLIPVIYNDTDLTCRDQ